MTGIPLSESKDHRAKAAIERLSQIKQQLNTSQSTMSLQAPKDIERERNACDFDIKELAYFLSGGQKKFEYIQKAFDIIKNDPELVVQPPRNFLELSGDEMRDFTMGQIYRMKQLTKEIKDKAFADEIPIALSIYSESFSMRFYVHESLFRNAICMLGNEEQQERYLDDINNCRILGCFAMTELGHSSALRKLETTATYDPSTDQFILNSPSVTSTKWWIGLAGQTATHAVVIAQTIILGKNVGLNWFVVQLRDKQTGQLEPDVQAGDIGQKTGRPGLDNGWIQFRQKRIPRIDMLAKWVHLDTQGNYRPAPNPAVMYATLIPERLSMVLIGNRMISQALTIATRYGVVRRQGNENQQIMDYQSHYVKILPAVAFAYVSHSALGLLDEQFGILTAGGKMNPGTYLNHMGYMHAMTSCLKAFTSWYSTEVLETCRRSCGGHAFSSYNALGQIIGDWGVMTTGAGDNVVLLQQTARYLINVLEKVELGIFPDLEFKSSIEYIKDAKRYLEYDTWSVGDASNGAKDFSLLFEAMHAILVKRLYSIKTAIKSNTEEDLLLECVRVAELHCAVFMFGVCSEKFGQSKDSLNPSVQAIMKKVTALWGMHVLYTYSDQGFKEGYFNSDHIKSIEIFQTLF
ncbi:hypothetical protein G6F56_006516 [Rhizopus delemar]|nr:hypothetical protein G6F56_006516 [Rhizopus delemar]